MRTSIVTTTQDHGLRFLNAQWNGTITNSQPLTLTWNETVLEAELYLNRATYNGDGERENQRVLDISGQPSTNLS
jgi:hypothetical protein